ADGSQPAPPTSLRTHLPTKASFKTNVIKLLALTSKRHTCKTTGHACLKQVHREAAQFLSKSICHIFQLSFGKVFPNLESKSQKRPDFRQVGPLN
ncbi:MAG: hypothetical protein ACI87E_002363, partial [Mariniblastus sp.]